MWSVRLTRWVVCCTFRACSMTSEKYIPHTKARRPDYWTKQTDMKAICFLPQPAHKRAIDNVLALFCQDTYHQSETHQHRLEKLEMYQETSKASGRRREFFQQTRGKGRCRGGRERGKGRKKIVFFVLSNFSLMLLIRFSAFCKNPCKRGLAQYAYTG